MAMMTRADGGRAFGDDPHAYDRGRLDYPTCVWDILHRTCGIGPGSAGFEIGPGTGKATRALLDLGIASLVGIEADPRLAAYLESELVPAAGGRLKLIAAPFQDVSLPEAAFDFGLAASAFHWLDEVPALQRIAGMLRPGGWWAMCWNVLGDPAQPDPFHEATQDLFAGWPAVPSDPKDGRPHFAVDTQARLGALRAAGFAEDGCEMIRWTASFDAGAMRALYATFSPLTRFTPDERESFLNGIAHTVDRDFGGSVERAFVTPVYAARRA